MTILDWLTGATKLLTMHGTPSARLDAEIILAHTIRKPRTWLHAHSDDPLDLRQREIADARVELRREHTPVAYIIGHKEFYGRRFKVTPATLIPRPESEAVIRQLAPLVGAKLTPIAPEPLHVVDVGTGSGCLGITAKLEWPAMHVTLTDKSQHALAIAKENARTLNADVAFYRGDLLRGYSLPADIIIANLPYVDREWSVSPDTHAEPDDALYADQHGLALIYTLITQSTPLLTPHGFLLLEADPTQHDAIIARAAQHQFNHVATDGYCITLQRSI